MANVELGLPQLSPEVTQWRSQSGQLVGIGIGDGGLIRADGRRAGLCAFFKNSGFVFG